jgi:hypothetical protein
MLYYGVNSLDALDELEEADCHAFKEEANKKAVKTLVFDPFDFSLPVKFDLKTLAFIKAQMALQSLSNKTP